MNKKQNVGITETGDISFNLEAFDNLFDANIIITKRLTDKLIDKLIEYKDKCILHLTVTGMGGSKIEPLTPTKEQMFDKFTKLISEGFPLNQVVLRIDPIIPTDKGINTAVDVLELFGNSGITRVRYSSMDMYQHVIDRFNNEGVRLPYESFHAPEKQREAIKKVFLIYSKLYKFEIECCGEPGVTSIGCISQKDIDILGLTDKIILSGNADQRGTCSCPSNKKQLIKQKPNRCANKCLYCFWKD